MKHFSPILAALFYLTFPDAGFGQSVPVTSEFQAIRHEWPQKSGALEIRWIRLERDHQVLVCGAIRHINARARKANRGLLRKGWVRAGSDKGPIVLRDLSYFADVSTGEFSNSLAQCQAIDDTGKKDALLLGFDAHSGYDAHMDMF